MHRLYLKNVWIRTGTKPPAPVAAARTDNKNLFLSTAPFPCSCCISLKLSSISSVFFAYSFNTSFTSFKSSRIPFM
ncbi:ORF072 [Staphylococcus phage 37]|uniref:ORF072 n=1 Tax=Staphylococcus phage 37 TaxID=2936813 RepID=Q4ZCC8_9CAUD|nr:ORF072 [Staphylococcus phage 37]